MPSLHPLLAAVSVIGLLALAGRGLADAPPGRYVARAPGTVNDTVTGLTWQQPTDAGKLSFPSAVTYCKSLPLAGGGFRLPTVKELETLVDRRQTAPSIDRAFFPGTAAERYWSGSPYAPAPADAWAVDFDRGGASHLPLGTTLLVRCVR